VGAHWAYSPQGHSLTLALTLALSLALSLALTPSPDAEF